MRHTTCLAQQNLRLVEFVCKFCSKVEALVDINLVQWAILQEKYKNIKRKLKVEAKNNHESVRGRNVRM